MKPSEIRSLFAVASRPEIVSLAGGMPNLSAIPMDMMAGIVEKLIRDDGQEALQYGSGQGHPHLREQICDVMALEGIKANPNDVLVTTGSQQALDLISRIFIDPGDVVLVEAPSYVGALGTFAQYEASVVHVEMDQNGLIPESLRQAIKTLRYQGRRIKFLYLIPNYQNPAGVLLPADRRTEILDICRSEKIFIVEDNPYGLLGFDRPSPNAMRAEDSENVIYLGSFSKTIVPGFRIGWALVPQSLKEKLVIASESSILCPSNFSQMAIASYLANQPWREQIASFCALYKVRRDAMLSALDAYFPKAATWTKPAGGFYVWVTLPPEIDTKAMVPRAIAAKVAYVPGTAFYADGFGSWSLRLSYCYPTPERITQGVMALSKVVEQEMLNRGITN
ncbi:MAG: PLP-dependent aminotransferase family protein [Actinobacteria bacterium]|nr:PLP-dependent aminotransferase family protein [Actinomycetota bacterium]